MCDLNGPSINGSDLEEVDLVQWIAYGYISPVIITFGVVGDLMTMLILMQPPLRHANVIYLYLSFLAVTDLCTLFSVVPMLLWLLRIRLCSYAAAVYYAHIGFPLVNAFMGASVWIVVFFTLSQFVGVCYPFKYTFKRKRVCIYLTILGYILSFGLYIPWGFKNHVVHNQANDTEDVCPYVSCENHELLTTEWYIAYQWVREIISRLLPFCFIAYFNMRILYTYQKSQLGTGTVKGPKRSNSKTKNNTTEIRRNRRNDNPLDDRGKKEERRLLFLLMGIIFLFFICTIPAAPLTILVKEEWSENFTFQLFRALINTLEFTKFALNFYFYCMVNPDLRKLTILRLTCQPYKKGPLIGLRPSAVGSSVKTSSITNIRPCQSKKLTPDNLMPLLSSPSTTPTYRTDVEDSGLHMKGVHVLTKRAQSECSSSSINNVEQRRDSSFYSLVYLDHQTDTQL